MDNEQDKEVIEHFKQLGNVLYGGDYPPKFVDMCYQISISAEFKKVINKGRYNLKQLETSDASFDIAVNVATIHWYWTLPLSSDARDEKWNDEGYLYKLKNKVILQCDNRLGLNLDSIVNYYSRVPIIYVMHILTNTCITELNNYSKGAGTINIVEHYDYISLKRMLNLSNAILYLIETYDFSSAYSLLRSLIESLFTYLAIKGKEDAIEEYYKFSQFSYLKEITKNLPKGVSEAYPDHYKKSGFANYGWLLTLAKERGDDVKDLEFKFETIIDYCQSEGAKKEGDRWLEMYRRCCHYVHASPFETQDPNIDFLNLSSYLSTILSNVAKQFCTTYKGKVYTENISNLIDELEKERKTYNIISKGYQEKINNEFRASLKNNMLNTK